MSDFSFVTRHKLKSDTRHRKASTGISLTHAAKELGVTREHLSRVLHGHRQSISLTKRFHDLTKSKKSA